MIEKILSYTDLLALLLAVAISGLIIFSLFFLGFIQSESAETGVDSDVELDADTDFEVDSEMDFDGHLEIDSDINMEIDTELDHEISFDSELDTEISSDFDHDVDTDFESDLDTDIQTELHSEIGTHDGFEAGLETSGTTGLVRTIETDGGGSLFAQVGAFCLAFGMFGFFVILSIGQTQSEELITKLDIAVGFIFLIGLAAYKLSNIALKSLTKGSISPIASIEKGQKITIVSKLIDHQNQGRVLVTTADGDKIMMAIAHDIHDLFYEGDQGIVTQLGVPLRIAKESTMTKKWV